MQGKTQKQAQQNNKQKNAQQYLIFLQIAKTLVGSNLLLANVPTKYHKFTKLFSEKFENKLPEYGFYNYKIPLKKGQHRNSIKYMDLTKISYKHLKSI